MLHAVIWIISIVSYAFAIHLGVSEGLAKLILLVVLAETFISWAFGKEMKKREREAIESPARTGRYSFRTPC